MAAYRRFLVGIGAPKGPTQDRRRAGPERDRPGANEQNQPVINGSAEWPGGVVVSRVNGWITWALARAGRRGARTPPPYAWNEFKRNTLAAHAVAFPEHWDGVITVDDECACLLPVADSGVRDRAGHRLRARVNGYDTQIMHQPAYSLFDLLKLAGLEATSDGYRSRAPPADGTFNVRLPDVGLAQQSGLIRGYLRTSGGSVTMHVAPPPGVAAEPSRGLRGRRARARHRRRRPRAVHAPDARPADPPTGR